MKKTTPDCSFRPLIAVVGVLLACASASAQYGDREDGIPVGPWIVAPFGESSVEYDGNIFRADDANDEESDLYRRVLGGVRATLPVRNSAFRLGYVLDNRKYESSEVTRKTSHNASGEFQFVFSTGDTLLLRDAYVRGVSDVTEVSDGGELVFDGVPFDLNRWAIQLARLKPRQQGYLVRMTRIDVNYQVDFDENGIPEQRAPYFDYRGFETEFEYRQPMAGRRFVVAQYRSRRMNNYDPNDRSKLGIPFRKEETDRFEVGLRGRLGGGQPYHVRVGYGRFEYPDRPTKNFSGLVGAARVRFPVGGRSNIGVDAERRPLASSYATYYVNEQVGVSFGRDVLRSSDAEVSFTLRRNRYADPIPGIGCDVIDPSNPGSVSDVKRRKDLRGDLDANFDWKIHERIAIRFSGNYTQRDSNCTGLDYQAIEVASGLLFGWF